MLLTGLQSKSGLWIGENRLFVPYADPEGGGGRGSTQDPPPRDLSEVGSCVDVRWVGEGVQMLFLSYYYNFYWLASLAITIERVNAWKIFITSKFQVPSPRSSYTRSLAFMKVHFHVYFCLKLHDVTPFKTKIFSGGEPPNPPRQSVPEITHIFTVLKNYVECGLGGEKTLGRSYIWKVLSQKLFQWLH